MSPGTAVQTDTEYVEALIALLTDVADQTDRFVAEGLDLEACVGALDVSAHVEKFAGGDEFLATRFRDWFRDPVARTAYKESVGEPTEILERTEEDE